MEPWVDRAVLALDIFNYFCILVYVVDILLKWLDNFTAFWKSPWEVFDFIITFCVSNLFLTGESCCLGLFRPLG